MEEDDVNQALRAAENAMRDYIALVLSRVHGPDWMDKAVDPKGSNPNVCGRGLDFHDGGR